MAMFDLITRCKLYFIFITPYIQKENKIKNLQRIQSERIC